MKVLILLALGLLIILIFVHEFIHWVTLKVLGYKGKLVFGTKGVWIFKGIGIKPIGVHDNFICAKDIYKVLGTPLIFGWMWFIPLLIPRFTYLDLFFGFLLWFMASIADLIDMKRINIWWIKPNKNLWVR